MITISNSLYNVRFVAGKTGVPSKEIERYCEATQRKPCVYGKKKGLGYYFNQNELCAIVAEIRYLKKLAPSRPLVEIVAPCAISSTPCYGTSATGHYSIRDVSAATLCNQTTIKRFCRAFLNAQGAHYRFNEEEFRKIVVLFRFLKIVNPSAPLKAFHQIKGISVIS
jgi:hypothetical protein